MVIGIASLLSTANALAQDLGAAGRHFTAGKEAFDRGQWSRAADEFESAYQITRDPVLLFNVGESYDRAGNGRAAVRSFRLYLERAPTASDRPAVEKRIAELETKYALTTPPTNAPRSLPDAQSSGRPAGTPPPTAIAPPHAPVIQQFVGAPSRSDAVSSTAPPAAPIVAPPSAAPSVVSSFPPSVPPSVSIAPPHAPVVERQPGEGAEGEVSRDALTVPVPENGAVHDAAQPSRARMLAWVGVAATVAFVTAGAIMGLAAQSRSDEIGRREQMVGNDGQPARFDAATEAQFTGLRSDGQSFDRAAIALLTAAGVTAVASGVLFYVDRRGRRVDGKPLTLAPTFDPRGAGISARLEF